MDDINVLFPLRSHIPDFSVLTGSVLTVPPTNYLIGCLEGKDVSLSPVFLDYHPSSAWNLIMKLEIHKMKFWRIGVNEKSTLPPLRRSPFKCVGNDWFMKNLCNYLCASIIKVLTVLSCLIFIKCSSYTRNFPLHWNSLTVYSTKYRTEYILLLSSDLISKSLLNYMYANALASVDYYHYCYPATCL